jgi:hexosaminidase
MPPFLPFFSFLALFLLPTVRAVWPQPRHLQTGPPTSALRLAPSDSFIISLDAVPNAPPDLLEAVKRTHSHLFSDNLGRLVLGRGASDLGAIQLAPTLTRLTLQLDHNASSHIRTTDSVVFPIEVEAKKPLGLRDEAYSLYVPADGTTDALLKANSTLGLFRGLNTFSQLWFTVQGTVYMLGAPVEIHDSPVYVRCMHACLVMPVVLLYAR